MPFHTKKHFKRFLCHRFYRQTAEKKRQNEYLFSDLGNGHFAAGAVEVQTQECAVLEP